MKSVFILWHVHQFEDREDDAKLIGVYASSSAAKLAQTRAKRLPGFSRCPKGFAIHEYEIGKDEWTEGYVTVCPGTNLPDRRTHNSSGRRVRASASGRAPVARRR